MAKNPTTTCGIENFVRRTGCGAGRHFSIGEVVKIWHLTRTISGGAGQYALRLSNALRAAGADSTVLVAEGPAAEHATQLRRLDSRIRRFVARGFRSVYHRLALGAYHSLRGPELYATPTPILAGDIVHLHGMTGWIGVPGLRRLVPSGVKVFWTAHDLWLLSGGCVVYRGCDRFRQDCSACPLLKSPWRGFARRELQVKRTFLEAGQVRPIANSRWMADRLHESSLFGRVKNIPIIPPIVDAAYLAEDISDLRAELKIPSGRLVISLGARSLDDKYKGIPEFLTALARVPELAGQLTVLLFGPGQIEIPANLDARLLGNLADPRQLARVYRTSDVYVSPSLMETFGMTLVEAQAVGAPVLAFSVGGIPEAVRNGVTGWLAPVGQFDELVKLLGSILPDSPKRTMAGDHARNWVRQTFAGDAVARLQSSCYQT
jgi:glycosyltransferase involved in cell wall biosynthesis